MKTIVRFCKDCDTQENLSSPPFSDYACRKCGGEFEFREIEKKEIKQNEVMSYDNINPDHYKTNDKEVWEYMIEIYGKDKFIAFCELNVFKYSMRVGKKPGASVEDDLGKIKWYAEKIKQLRDE